MLGNIYLMDEVNDSFIYKKSCLSNYDLSNFLTKTNASDGSILL